MVVTLCNQPGIRRRHSAPEASASSECAVAWSLPVSGIMPSAEISPERSGSRCLRDVPISCRRKAPTAMRNAAHTRRGGVSTLRSLSIGLTSLQPATIFAGYGQCGCRQRPAGCPQTAQTARLGALRRPGWVPVNGPRVGAVRGRSPAPQAARTAIERTAALLAFSRITPGTRPPARPGRPRPRWFRARRPALPQTRRVVGAAWQYRIGHAGRQ
jgi:hypothetical protein